MFIHDYIKIKYTTEGYLENNPPYLISDKEMFNAFIQEDGSGFFADYYPCPGPEFNSAYVELKSYIVDKIQKFLNDGTEIPDWIYSYMIMRPITYQSDELNIYYLYELAGMKSLTSLAEFTPELADLCYQVSVDWIKRLPSRYADRPPTMFGETHVTKSLRLNQANVLID